MLIIFGFRSKVSQIIVMVFHCPSCNNQVANPLYRIRRYFTLFFLPVFPVSTKYTLVCTMCNSRRIISKADAEVLINSERSHPQSPLTQVRPGTSAVPPDLGSFPDKEN
ncbi:MAG: zinc-ribbon domain-containing protein [Acidimicrobiales bacterium]|nr:zinc-ribbon domain-containing protein [Acidimicrobiales bacterium]